MIVVMHSLTGGREKGEETEGGRGGGKEGRRGEAERGREGGRTEPAGVVVVGIVVGSVGSEGVV